MKDDRTPSPFFTGSVGPEIQALVSKSTFKRIFFILCLGVVKKDNQLPCIIETLNFGNAFGN